MNAFVENPVRDAVINRLLQDPDNKVSCLIELTNPISLLLAMLRLQEQESEVEQFEHWNFPLLSVHEQAPLNGRAHLIR